LSQEETTAADLGRIIEQDIGMTAKILKLVNSAFFGLRRELTSPSEAVTYLGMETVRSLVLANGIFEGAEPLGTRRITLDEIWNHSLAVGQGARNILRILKGSEHDQNDALTSGLLHDVGLLILARHFPEAYDEVLGLVDSENYLLSLAEQRVLGVNHAEVGAYLVGLWGLPKVIVQSVRFHHSPALSPEGILRPTPVCAVHLADGLMAEPPAHAAFERAILDPDVLQSPWLAGKLETIRGSLFQ
ncbi:MAG TPA: HDOD domain-containing protein, partial [Holophaga sp.]|nr:HDOD domain-containing protein [Holophaga sp.]